jgi:lincosamide and streptogramin A transport system ATP-binding/permease protein
MQSRAASIGKRIDREIEEKEGLLSDIEEIRDLKLTALTHHKNVLVSVRDFILRYADAEAPVLNGVTFELRQGDRIALVGGNGCGKSTLIRRILKSTGAAVSAETEESGVCETASGLVVSYVDQDTSGLRGSLPDFCEERGIDRTLFCTILRQLGLEREQFVKDIAELSEGQKKKVLISASLCTPAHLYIWDEPLNFMDVFSRIQLETLLLGCTPTMLFVEHDNRFRDAVATGTVTL